MITLAAAVLFALAFAACGFTLVFAFSSRGAAWGLLEFVTAAVLSAVCATTLAGIALAHAGFFSPFSLAAVLGAVACLALPRALRGIRGRVTGGLTRWEAVALAAAVAIALFSVARRADEVEGMRDPGVYAAAGIELARTGDLGWTDPLIARAGFSAAKGFLVDWGDFHHGRPRWERMPGFAIYDEQTGEVRPQFLGGYEVWLALAHSLGGPKATQCVNAAFAALAILSLFCAMRLVTSPAAAALGAVFLAANPAQLWFARFTSNEIMIQALLWGFLFLYERAGDDGDDSGDAGSFYPAVLLLATAAVVKFAAWMLLPLVAFAASMRCAWGQLRVPRLALWLLLPGIGLAAWLHARVFAHYYLYGTWAFSAAKLGVSFGFFPVLFVGAIAAAVSAGSLFAPAMARVAEGWGRRRVRFALLGALGFAFVAAYAWQWVRFQAAGAQADVWHEKTNLVELALYFSPVPFLAGAAGLLLLAFRTPPRRAAMFLALLAGAALFLVQRRLDALHPWGARRWVPFLVPAWCVGMGCAVALVARNRGRAVRILAGIAAIVLAVLMLRAAPALVRTPNHRGMIESLDRLAGHLRSEDVVLAQPSVAIAQYAPYLKARFDLDLYVQQYRADSWAQALPLLRKEAAAGRRILYLADEPMAVPGLPFATLLAREPVRFRAIAERLHALPESEQRIDTSVFVYSLDPAQIPDGWWPKWKPPVPKMPRSPLPAELRLGAAAEPHLRGFFDPTPAGGDRWYRWTDGRGKIAVGELVDLPTSSARLRVTVRMGTGRAPEAGSVGVDWFLDMDHPDHARRIGSSAVGDGFRDYSVELGSAMLKGDSVLELWSLRPAVGTEKPVGELGVAVESVRIEAAPARTEQPED